MKAICGIYLYRDLKEDEVIYVGQSVNIYSRHRSHLSPSSYNSQPINRVLQNDPSRYTLEIERRCSKEELNDLEKMYIEVLKPKFNFTPGGNFNITDKDVGKYTLWDNSKVYYVNNTNHNRNKPFRWYYKGWYVACGYFLTWNEIECICDLAKEELE